MSGNVRFCPLMSAKTSLLQIYHMGIAVVKYFEDYFCTFSHKNHHLNLIFKI